MMNDKKDTTNKTLFEKLVAAGTAKGINKLSEEDKKKMMAEYVHQEALKSLDSIGMYDPKFDE